MKTSLIQLKNSSDVVLLDLTDGLPIKKNADFGRVCYDQKISNIGAGTDIIQVRWTFARAGAPLKMEDGDKLVITFNDDFTGLTDHTFMVQGTQS